MSANWRESGPLRATIGCSHISALRGVVEKEVGTILVEASLRECFDCLIELFEKEGYIGFLVHECFKVLDEVLHFASRVNFSKPFRNRVCLLVDAHLMGMCMEHRDRNFNDPKTHELLGVLSTWDCGGPNPMRIPLDHACWWRG